jgi:hypothetical protein
MAAPREPVIALDELRRRYDALGPIREYIGERTFAGRCHSFQMFLEYGQVFSDYIASGGRVDDIRKDFPGLVDLVKEAWPQR